MSARQIENFLSSHPFEGKYGVKHENSQQSLFCRIANILSDLLSRYVFSLPHLALKHSFKYKHTLYYLHGVIP